MKRSKALKTRKQKGGNILERLGLKKATPFTQPTNKSVRRTSNSNVSYSAYGNKNNFKGFQFTRKVEQEKQRLSQLARNSTNAETTKKIIVKNLQTLENSVNNMGLKMKVPFIDPHLPAKNVVEQAKQWSEKPRAVTF
jgi:preprotein translocase subunit SecD